MTFLQFLEFGFQIVQAICVFYMVILHSQRSEDLEADSQLSLQHMAIMIRGLLLFVWCDACLVILQIVLIDLLKFSSITCSEQLPASCVPCLLLLPFVGECNLASLLQKLLCLPLFRPLDFGSTCTGVVSFAHYQCLS